MKARRRAATAISDSSDGRRAAQIIREFIDRLATSAGWHLGARIREIFDAPQIADACKSARERLPSPRSAVTPSSVVVLGAAGVLLALVLLSLGELFAAAGLIVALLGGVLFSLRRREDQSELVSTAEEALETDLGTDLRRVLRPRGELAALLTQLGIEAARIGTI